MAWWVGARSEMWRHALSLYSSMTFSGAGMDDGNSPFTSIKDALKDSKRVKYHNDYLTNLAASIKQVHTARSGSD